MLLKTVHAVDDSCWEFIQIDKFSPPEPLKEQVVPLARLIDDMTATFSAQVNELAQTYNISPHTLRNVAVHHICGKGSGEQSPITSTPASVPKTQATPNPRTVASGDFGHLSSATQISDGSLSVNPLPADVQRVIVEHIVKHDSTVAFPPARELCSFSGNSPKPTTEVDYGIWRLRVKQVLHDYSLSDAQ